MWCNKVKTFRRVGGKDSFEVTNDTYVCEFHDNITDVNVSAERNIKTLKPNVVPSVFSFIKNKPSKNQSKRRSPGKRRLITEFVKPKNCERLSFENLLLKENVKVLEEEKNKLEEESKCSNIYTGSLKSMLFSYDNFITYEKLFRATTGLEVEKFKVLYKNLDPGENCENIKYHEPAKYKKEDRSDLLFSPSFFHLYQNQDLHENLLALTNCFFILSWLRHDSPMKHTACLFNLSKSTASRNIITWESFIYFKLVCVPIWLTKDKN